MCECSAVKRLVGENKLPHLLFYGPPGTGKTSTILAVARQIYGASFQSMVLELNASDDRGIGVVRQQVQDFASSRTLFGCDRVCCPVAILNGAQSSGRRTGWSEGRRSS
jgi:replication factor C subunit 3/5